LAAVAFCVAVGLALGLRYFGPAGLIVGGIIGFLVGHVVGCLPDRVSTKMFFRELERSSNAELRSMVAADDWNFQHTMALLHLAARNEDVHGELPRIIGMLESDSRLTRVYGWDALRIVFNKETEIIGDYNPRESAEECRSKAARLKATLEEKGAPAPTKD